VVSWQDLVQTVRDLPEASALWVDFADFLVEVRGNLVPRGPISEGALSAEWIAGAIEVAMKGPVAWCNWGRGRVLTQVRKHQDALGRRFIQRWAPWQMTYIELAGC
jgi:hypothetical protein